MFKLKYLLLLIIALLIAVAGAAGWIAVDLHRFANRPADGEEHSHIVSVAPGESFGMLSARLEKAGVITSDIRFKIIARLSGDDKRLRAGEYALSTAMTPMEIIDILASGKVLLHRLTIPEGYTIDQVATEVEKAGLASAEEFSRLARDPSLVSELQLDGPSLEGYLFPDTYHFPREVSARGIITTMVNAYQSLVTDEWRNRAHELDLSIHDIVTLASIIEKETGAPSERPIIASVFHNRLKKRMRLESDPTVIYGIESFDGNITRRHLSSATPYNTYVIRGLPPGPIANPGRAALEAALYPAETDYLFFVSKKDGTHYFSKTIAEHTEAVRKYQLRRKRH
ncbi:endolytic transglycosylase MltG [Desulfatitalea tepidiphila]|uniref:endolytic transglycosylase MltG n=1 Tax=Desulfatitalea tepidiphila TaxID=1185843 RepID=UPI0006B5C5BF|nr:endolytic transglycosylase MltG [Desulfatitalea tepidiphila]